MLLQHEHTSRGNALADLLCPAWVFEFKSLVCMHGMYLYICVCVYIYTVHNIYIYIYCTCAVDAQNGRFYNGQVDMLLALTDIGPGDGTFII